MVDAVLQSIVTGIYSQAYPRIVRTFPPYQRLHAEIADIVAAHRQRLGRRPRILDMAAGSGDLAFALADAGYEVVGIEPIGGLRRIAARRASSEHRAVTFTAEAAIDDGFDVVLSLHSLYADLGWQETLRFAREALRPGGIAIFVNFVAPVSILDTLRGLARQEGWRAATRSLLWLLPNATFDVFRRPRTPTFWPEGVLEARVREAGFDVAESRRTFLRDVSALVIARKSDAPVARATRALARVVLYEVSEAVRFAASEERDEAGEPIWVRSADAALFGNDVTSLAEQPLFTPGMFVSARARSAVAMPGGRGSITCSFDLLMDGDPSRPSLDKLLVTASGTLDGRLDLRDAARGYACGEGRWSLPDAHGTFTASFLIPTRRPDHDGFWYVEHDVDGHVRPEHDGAWRPLRPDEFVLGIPVTKVILAVYGRDPA